MEEGIPVDEVKEAFLRLLTEKIHAALWPVLFPNGAADFIIEGEYRKICHEISKEAAIRFFESFGEKR